MNMNCGTCRLEFSNDDYLKCNGVCDKYFHGKIVCSGVKADVAKLISKLRNVHYVCDDCKKAKLFHVLESVKICNDNVMRMHTDLESKFNELSAMSSTFLSRVSCLESSVNDVTTIEDSVRLEDDLVRKMELLNERHFDRLTRQLESKMSSMIHDLVLPNFEIHKLQSDKDKQDLLGQFERLSHSFSDLNAKVDDPNLMRSIDSLNAKLEGDMYGLQNRLEEIINQPVSCLSNVAKPPTQTLTMNDIVTIDIFPTNSLNQDGTLNNLTLTDSIMSEIIDSLDEINASYVSLESSEGIDSPQDVASTDELNASFITLDATGDATFHDDVSDNNEWIYVASAEGNFCETRLRNILLWDFGLDNLRIDLLSRNVEATYMSFKVQIPSENVTTALNHKRWPKSYYVRRFENEKKSVFQPGSPADHRRTKRNFVHNPIKLRI